MSYADVNGISLHYDLFASPDLAGVVIPFLDAASLEPPPPAGQ